MDGQLCSNFSKETEVAQFFLARPALLLRTQIKLGHADINLIQPNGKVEDNYRWGSSFDSLIIQIY